MDNGQSAAVIGAGIVGVCTALYLQRAGYRVSLIDRAEPGRGCSYGNGAALGFGSCVPLSMPGTVRRVPKMLFDPFSPLAIRRAGLMRTAPWMLRFLRQCTPAGVEETADARNHLLRHLYDGLQALLDDAGANDLVRRSGMLITYESEAAFAADRRAQDIRAKRGVEVRTLSGDDVRDLEPALGAAVSHGVLLPQVGIVANPLRLTQVLLRHFLDRGGELIQAAVTGFEFGKGGVRAVIGDGLRHATGCAVICAGAWSRPLAAWLGSPVPLAAERGYHVQLPRSGVTLGRSVVSAERSIAFISLEPGLRIVGGSEFAAIDSAPDPRRFERMTALARQVFPKLDLSGMETWMGPRPSMPDSRPVLGRSPRHANVLFNFGHDHIGLALAGITGKLVAELAQGQTPSLDISAYRPDRF
jgi:D-amino-acid dehydrogenase